MNDRSPKLSFDKDLSFHASVDSDLLLDHGIYYSTRRPFVPITALDSSGRPRGCILDGADTNRALSLR